MKKIVCIFLAIIFCTLSLEVQAQTAAESTYNQAVELMYQNKKSSLKRAIKAFQKAQIGFSSQENKDRCQKGIDECNEKLAKLKNKIKDNKPADKDKTADYSFSVGKEFLKEGKLNEAKVLFMRAKDLFPQTATDKIKECDEMIAFCDCPISFEPSEINCSANGTNEEGIEIKVTALSTENWIIMVELDAQEWLSVSTDEKKSSIKVFLQPNGTENPRDGVVTLAIGNNYTKMCRIYQKGAVIFSQQELEFAKKSGGSQIVAVKAPAEWSIGQTDEWIIAQKLDDGSNRIDVRCADMTDDSERHGKVEVCCGEDKFFINIHQVSKKTKFWNNTKKFGKKIINK